MDESEDINQLIRQLNKGDRPQPSNPDVAVPRSLGEETSASPARLTRWLEELVARAGSDLLLVAGAPPCVRVDGKVTPLPEAPLSGDEIEDAVLPVLSFATRARYEEQQIADGSAHQVELEA